MTLVVEEPGLRSRDVRSEPSPVRERHHAVLRPLPYRHGHADVREVEAPRVHERDVVVEPAPDAGRDGLVQHGGRVLGELAGERRDVDGRDEAAEGLGQIGGRRLPEVLRLRLEVAL